MAPPRSPPSSTPPTIPAAPPPAAAAISPPPAAPSAAPPVALGLSATVWPMLWQPEPMKATSATGALHFAVFRRMRFPPPERAARAAPTVSLAQARTPRAGGAQRIRGPRRGSRLLARLQIGSHRAQVKVPLRKGDLDARLAQRPVDFDQQVPLELARGIEVGRPHAHQEIERALAEAIEE